MSLQSITGLPTDNLYKFIAIFGLIILIFSFYFEDCKYQELIKTENDYEKFSYDKVGVDYELNEFKENREEIYLKTQREIFFKKYDLPRGTANPINESDKDYVEKSLDTIFNDGVLKSFKERVIRKIMTDSLNLEIKKTQVYDDYRKVERKRDRIFDYIFRINLLKFFSLFLIFIGFYFWYTKYQKFQDLEKKINYLKLKKDNIDLIEEEKTPK